MSEKKWLLRLAGITVILVLLLNAVIYAVDPFLQYRAENNSRYLNARYAGPGLIRNYEYDTLLLGNSMCENFNMELMRQELGAEPLHVCIGGVYQDELWEYVKLAEQTGKAKTIYLCVGLADFANEYESKSIDYLVKDDLLSRLRYAFSYEAWFRFIPMDLILAGKRMLGIPLSDAEDLKTDIDRMGNWADQYQYGENVVLKNYKFKAFSVSEVDNSGLYEKMLRRVDRMLDRMEYDGELICFFPPYSSLYWIDAQEKGHLDVYLAVKAYFIDALRSKGITVYDFQGAELTVDLNNYRDTTHYGDWVNDWMVRCFASGEYRITEQDPFNSAQQIRDNAELLRSTLEKRK